jgi:uncharacterized protein (TIGR03792 family)
MVIEFLTFTVDPADREAWMSVEEPGFIDKQLWTDREHADQVHAMIRWETEAHWHAIPHDELAAVDAEMGEWFRDCTMRVYDVLRDC